MERLFTPYRLGAIELKNRIVMAPMTRCRTTQPGNIPNELMAEYYAQRASAGLIVSEATQISPQGQGYSFTPGIHSPEQVAGWRKVTTAVRERGGRIFLQLWHVGRMSHETFQNGGRPVAPSALSPKASVWIVDEATGVGGMVECPVPRALALAEIQAIVEDYRKAAANAMSAGFDGVEIHGANGYLIDEFLRTSSNHRTDRYGGPVENRIRFPLEVAEAIVGEVGADRVGIRFSPFVTQRSMTDPEAPQAVLRLVKELNRMGLGYVHLGEADWDDAPETPLAFREDLRNSFTNTIIVAANYTKEKAEQILAAKLADLVAFGRPFIGNPDLPRRLQLNAPLAVADGSKYYGGDATGYTDYPGLA